MSFIVCGGDGSGWVRRKLSPSFPFQSSSTRQFVGCRSSSHACPPAYTHTNQSNNLVNKQHSRRGRHLGPIFSHRLLSDWAQHALCIGLRLTVSGSNIMLCTRSAAVWCYTHVCAAPHNLFVFVSSILFGPAIHLLVGTSLLTKTIFK